VALDSTASEKNGQLKQLFVSERKGTHRETAGKKMRVSVIDLGFNSLKLVSYEANEKDSSFVAYDQESVPARLGEGLSQTGFLGTEPMRRAIEGLKFFREVNSLYGVLHTLPVATSAVREAANRDVFLKQVFEETSFKFRVLTGREEALFSYSGASRALGVSNVLLFDIGGGSLEFVYSDGVKVRNILSLPLGGLRLTQLYADRDGSFREKAYSRMEKRIMELLPTREELVLKDDTILAGVGGNLRALTRWDQKLRDYPFNKIHNYSLKRESVEVMRKELALLTTKEIAEIDVIGKDRAQTLSAGSLVIESIMKKLEFRRLVVSTHGLRDGVLAAFLEDPLGYHQGRVGRIPPRVIRTDREREYERVTGKFLERLMEVDLIETEDAGIVRFAVKWLMGGASSMKPESVFSLMMDEDSGLSHRDQLLGSLTVVELRRARSANWLHSRYRSMLKQDSEHQVQKYAAICRFLEILIRTESKILIAFPEAGSKINLRISSRIPAERFPQKILGVAVNQLGDELDRFIEYKVKNASGPGDEGTQTGLTQKESVENNLESEKPYDG
jgi:exopolyphosphatase / guanosine-5'-triphosphate,3'-diphosphate pyrophosphatase